MSLGRRQQSPAGRRRIVGSRPEVRAPATLIAGERDEKFRAIATEMARELRDARVAVIPDAGHAVHLEAPAPVAAVIRQG